MASRLISDLLPPVAVKAREWLIRLRRRQVDPLIYCTWRPAAEQDSLYAKGRTTIGPRVTNARGWQSWHQMHRAWDCVPMRDGKPVWAYTPYDPDWEAMVEEADALGIEWAGRWHDFREYVHFQVRPGGLTLAQAKIDTLAYEADIHIV